ncbi:MAG: pitrilysin family protein, partial [Proteobacteria bacterium]|nr:pitrilysin family protein [Pseudomonadota bacterium]
MRMTTVGALVLATLAPVLVEDQVDAGVRAPPQTPDPTIPAERYTLPNGLEIILSVDKATPLVAVNVWYHVGSGAESPGRSGFAHLFEHMMFQGSVNVGKDNHFAILKKIGSEQINGTTNTDRTNYFEVVPANQLEAALWLESDRMGHLLEFLDKGSLDNQIDTVKNERRQNYDNVAYRKALFAEYETLYPREGHPYRHLTIGKHEDLTAATVDDVKNFFRTWYVPSNATIAIVGNIDVAATKQLVAKWFGTFPASTKPTLVPVPPGEIARTKVTVVDQLAKLPQVVFAWHSPANFAPGDAELDIVANVLGAEGFGTLYKKLVIDDQLAQSVRVEQGGSGFSGVFEVTVTLRTGAKVEDVERRVLSEVPRYATEMIAQNQVARVVAARESSMIRGLENVFVRSQTLQTYNHYVGDPGKLTWDLDRYRNVSLDR